MKPRLATLLTVVALGLVACGAVDQRGGDPGPCPLAESLSRPGNSNCKVRRACRLRSDMFIECTPERKCTCNRDDGTIATFEGSCLSLLSADDACGDGT